MKIFQPILILTTLSLILPETGRGQSQSITTGIFEDHTVVFESLQLIRETKGETGLSSISQLITEMNRQLGLQLSIYYDNEKLLTIATPEGRKIKFDVYYSIIHEAAGVKLKRDRSLYDFEVQDLCRFLRPLIEKKLNDINFHCDYFEFLSDLLFTLCDGNSWLMQKQDAISILQHGNIFSSLTLKKDSIGNFLLKTIAKEIQSGMEINDKIISIGEIPSKYIGIGMAYKLIERSQDHDLVVSLERNGNAITHTIPKLKGIEQYTDSVAIIPTGILYIKPKEFRKSL